MMQRNKKQLIISSVMILLPAVAGLLLWNLLPERIAIHWGPGGEEDGWSGRAFAVFGLPVLLLAVHWLCVFITVKDPKNKEQNDKVFHMVLWIIPMISLVTGGIVYAAALGYGNGIDTAVCILLGMVFVIIGNYMPKCKQNRTIGVRVTWTLRSEENWYRTHRFAGRVWVLGGVLIWCMLFVPVENPMYMILAVTMLLAFSPILYSYIYHRKQLKTGEVEVHFDDDTPL